METKPDSVKIVQIAPFQREGGTDVIYGLGDDGMVYRWLPSEHIWKLWASKA